MVWLNGLTLQDSFILECRWHMSELIHKYQKTKPMSLRQAEIFTELESLVLILSWFSSIKNSGRNLIQY